MNKSGELIVLDTNILVAAGFNRGSRSAQLLTKLREGELNLVWNQTTRDETRKVVKQIPPLAWEEVADLFSPETEFNGHTDPEAYAMVEDSKDRKFAALAAATGATLISNDDHLLSVRDQLGLTVLTPSEFFAKMG